MLMAFLESGSVRRNTQAEGLKCSRTPEEEQVTARLGSQDRLPHQADGDRPAIHRCQ